MKRHLLSVSLSACCPTWASHTSPTPWSGEGCSRWDSQWAEAHCSSGRCSLELWWLSAMWLRAQSATGARAVVLWWAPGSFGDVEDHHSPGSKRALLKKAWRGSQATTNTLKSLSLQQSLQKRTWAAWPQQSGAEQV